jgi:hypothetical protein
MQKLRVLVLAPDCNPESVTTPQIAYADAEALGRLHAVTLVVRAANEDPIRRAGGTFETIQLAAPEPMSSTIQLSTPIQLVNEGHPPPYGDKSLGLWQISGLPDL